MTYSLVKSILLQHMLYFKTIYIILYYISFLSNILQADSIRIILYSKKTPKFLGVFSGHFCLFNVKELKWQCLLSLRFL